MLALTLAIDEEESLVGQRKETVNLHQRGVELLEFLESEAWKRRSDGAVGQTLAVEVWSEETQLPVETAVDLHALEALSGVVQT